MNKPLLIEIGVEELPAIPFLNELPNIEKKWSDILEKNRLLCDFDFFYTPRRLVLWHREFQVKQEDSIGSVSARLSTHPNRAPLEEIKT